MYDSLSAGKMYYGRTVALLAGTLAFFAALALFL